MITTDKGREFRTYLNKPIDLIDDTILLELAIDWIKVNLEPEDVFESHQLELWAERNGFFTV